ncbi:hypothetical protein FQA47_016086 [Oryzias melastigma]|uniref:Uncharacterized protein n=1 Tax=Oryzias melastigma TaxID=30732 RepID=A0A834L0F3_ORYME|nr:hypothetical protein FQA47_016086 [Oryzias melastigma]
MVQRSREPPPGLQSDLCGAQTPSPLLQENTEFRTRAAHIISPPPPCLSTGRSGVVQTFVFCLDFAVWT